MFGRVSENASRVEQLKRYSSFTLTQSIGTRLRVKKAPVGLRSGISLERWKIGAMVID